MENFSNEYEDQTNRHCVLNIQTLTLSPPPRQYSERYHNKNRTASDSEPNHFRLAVCNNVTKNYYQCLFQCANARTLSVQMISPNVSNVFPDEHFIVQWKIEIKI